MRAVSVRGGDGQEPHTGEATAGQSSAQRQDQAIPWSLHWEVTGVQHCHSVPVQRTGGWGETETSAMFSQQVQFIPQPDSFCSDGVRTMRYETTGL